MNTLKNIMFFAGAILLIVSCKNEVKPEVKTVEVASEASKKLDPNAKYAKAEFTIDGMTCEIGCAKTIEKKIAKMEGVKSAKVDYDKKLAMVEYDEATVTTTSLEETVTNVADIYKVSNMKTVDAFSSKKCAADCKKECCAGKTEAEKKACAADCKKACCAQKA